jgi:hypothetical protein
MSQLSRLILAIGYVGGAALLLLLLTKNNVDALATRVGFTALSVIVLGLVAAAGARLLYHPEPVESWGWATLLIAATTFVLVLVEIWRQHDYFEEVPRTIVMVMISLLFGGGSLVLGGEDGGKAVPGAAIARRIALVALVALGVMTVLGASGVDIGSRWAGIAAVLFFVPGLSLPFLRWASEDDAVDRY